MKSLVKLALALLLFSLPLRAYAGWGVGVNAGFRKMDAAEYQKEANYMKTVGFTSGSSKITQGLLSPDVNLFYETAPNSGLSYGLSAGFGKAAGVKLEEKFSFSGTNGTRKIENTTTAIPASFYIKIKSDDKPYAFFGGAGFDLLSLKTTYKMQFSGTDTSGVFEKNKVVPNIAAGGEYYLTKNLSAGLNFKYMFSAKIKDLRGKVDGVNSKLIMSNNEIIWNFWNYSARTSRKQCFNPV